MTLKYNGKQLIIAGIFVLVIGVGAIVFGLSQRANFEAMKSWPVVQADVIRLIENYSEDEDTGRQYLEDYTVHVEFMLDGNAYSRAHNTRVRPGGTIEVSYNPRNPGQSHLTADPPTSSDFYYIGAVFLILGLLLFFFAFDYKKTNKQKKI